MPLPHIISKSIFRGFYHTLRLISRAKAESIERKVQVVDEEQRLAFDYMFDSALQSGPNARIDYNLPYPKRDFLNYLCDWRGYVAHGSPLCDLETLQPIRKSTDKSEFGNRQQIFASPDASWAMWFAILDKTKYRSTNNACIRLGTGANRIKHYYFGLPKNTREEYPFTEGMIYITHAGDFPDKREIPLLDLLDAEVEEWGSTKSIVPLARIKMKPEDFPYLDKVQFAS
ncbi:MAG TPA: hypothetical protein VIS72_13855 [Anaerolineales bacterium]